VARGEEPPEKVVQFKASLMGPLAALGDGFFWLSLRPAVGAFSVALVPVLEEWAAAVFLLLFNTVHLYARGRFFVLGYRHGGGLVEHLSTAHLPLWGERLRSVAAACAGGLVAWLALAFGQHEHGALGAVLVGACLAGGALTYGLLRRAVSPWALWYAGAALAIVAGALS
jgi:PTS system mannose-specific IID component